MPGHALETAPPELRSFLDRLIEDLRAHLGPKLAGVVLHGSLAMGCYYPPKSDTDLLIIVSAMNESAAADLYRLLQRHHGLRPYAAGLEVSAVLASDAARPTHPSPYLVHFSSGTRGPQAWRGGALPVDPDLCAHLTIARARGASLVGPPAPDLIGPVRREDYLAAVGSDIKEILAEGGLIRSPTYAVLNLCRWAMMRATKDPLTPSKEEAGLWAMEHVPPPHREVVAQALSAYRSAEAVDAQDLALASGPWDEGRLKALRAWFDGIGGP